MDVRLMPLKNILPINTKKLYKVINLDICLNAQNTVDNYTYAAS